MKNKDRSGGGKENERGQSTGNRQNTSQTSGKNNGGQQPRNNRFEGQGEGSLSENKSSRGEGLSRGNPGLG